ncbi:hypothetical protein ACWENA_01685 [Streptomyces sp. NPDC004779]
MTEYAQVPDLTRRDLEQADLAVGCVETAEVLLARQGPGKKWHLPADRQPRYGGCRYAHSAGEGQKVRLLDAIGSVCSQCRNAIALPAPVAGLWSACGEIVKAGRQAGVWAQAASRTWLDFARAQVHFAGYRDATVKELLAGPLEDEQVAEQARSVLGAWESVMDRQRTALSAFRAQCPDAVLAAAVGTACDKVLSDRGIEHTAERLTQAVRGGWGWNVRPDRVVCRAWSDSRVQGMAADVAGQAAVAALESAWGRRARVTDVSALEPPMLTSGEGHSTPAAWADAEFRERWNAFARTCWVRLEDALKRVHPGGAERVLLLVEGWPLVASADRDLAFLAQWDPEEPAVPTDFGLRRYEEYGSHDDFARHSGYETSSAVVLAVPAWAAQRAQEGSRHARRIRVGSRVTGEKSVDRRARMDLLRAVFPVLAEDFEADPAWGRASELVRSGRGHARSQLQAHRPFQPDGRDVERGAEWLEYLAVDRPGVLWVPGEDEASWAAAENLLHVLRGTFGLIVPVALLLETGPCSSAGLHTLHGRLVGVDRERELVVFALDGSDHWVFEIPVGRVVAVYRPGGLMGRHERPRWQAAG